jgi:uncharacterized caspase-like protein
VSDGTHAARRLLCAAALLAIVLDMSAIAWAAEVHRFAVVAGNNTGRRHEAVLRYAESDAGRFAEVLQELGGFPGANVYLLTGEGTDAFRDAVREIEAELERLGPEAAADAILMLYFSGHSDGRQLHFGAERLPFDELRAMVDRSAATIRVAVIDACRSGGLTREKGLRAGPAFELKLVDALAAKGSVVLTSSASNEASQESDLIAGSYFTHYLTTGLRGAADDDGDDRVTLAEVYRYAAGRTAAETAHTVAGSQHPSYDYRLTGWGEVVLADLSRRDATLIFEEALSGSFQILARGRRRVVGEITKPAGREGRYALSSGEYSVLHRSGTSTAVQHVVLAKGGVARISGDALEPTTVPTMLKGLEQRWVYRPARVHAPVLGGGLSWGGVSDLSAGPHAQIGYRIDVGPVTLLPLLTYMQAEVERPQVAYRFQSATIQLPVLYRFNMASADLMLGPSIGGSYIWQTFWDTNGRKGPHHDPSFRYSGIVGVWLPLVADLAMWLYWETGGAVYRIHERDRPRRWHFTQGLFLHGGVCLAWEF